MIKTITTPTPDQLQLLFNDATTINFILELYPNKQLKFMNGPVAYDTTGNVIEARSWKSDYRLHNMPVVEENSLSLVSSSVKAVLDEFFDFTGDREIYLFGIIISPHGCTVRAAIL